MDHGTHLAEGNLDTTTIARATRADGTIFSTLPVTLGTKSISRESEFGSLALVEVFERHLDSVNKIFSLANTLRTAAASTKEAAASKELAEEILVYECRWSWGA